MSRKKASPTTKTIDPTNHTPDENFDDFDDEVYDNDEPDFDELAYGDFDDLDNLESLDDTLDDDFDNDFDDDFDERPKRTASRKKSKTTNALVPAMPTSLTASRCKLGCVYQCGASNSDFDPRARAGTSPPLL